MTARWKNDLAWRYAGLSLLSHCLFIALSLLPGWRADPLLAGDSATYALLAENLVSRGAFSRESAAPYRWEPYRTPVYPAVLALGLVLFRSVESALFAAALTAGAAGWCAVRLVQRWDGSRRAQHAAGLLIAFLPNSLGLSARILTDASFGHMVLAWVYALTRGLDTSPRFLALAVVLAALLQGLKPTFNLAALLIAGAGLLLARTRNQWMAIGVLVALALPVPAYFSLRNVHDHGVFAPTFKDAEAFREHLQGGYLSRMAGTDHAVFAARLRALDVSRAQERSDPDSFHGRLYLVRRDEVGRFLREHPGAVASLMFSQTLRQLAAPQEFAWQIFFGQLPAWGRALGSVLTLTIFAAALCGAWRLGRERSLAPGLTVLGVSAFFLVTGALALRTGARLRFPADLVAVPLAAIGIGPLIDSFLGRIRLASRSGRRGAMPR